MNIQQIQTYLATKVAIVRDKIAKLGGMVKKLSPETAVMVVGIGVILSLALGQQTVNLLRENIRLSSDLLQMQLDHKVDILKLQREVEELKITTKTQDVTIRTLQNETRWVREQEPVSRASGVRGWTAIMKVTNYTAHPLECGRAIDDPDFGRTASGYLLTNKDVYKSVAVDPRIIPLGSTVIIHHPKLGNIVAIARDTGSAVKGFHIDLFVSLLDRQRAFAWGVQELKVTVIRKNG
jgi:3D (Asp-Asp-Asp) domain-containing protein